MHGIDGAGEIGDEAIARRGEDPTAMRGDQRIGYGPVSVEGAKGADLIQPHQAAIALDIGRKDCRELSFDLLGFQPRHLPDPSIARRGARSEGL